MGSAQVEHSSVWQACLCWSNISSSISWKTQSYKGRREERVSMISRLWVRLYIKKYVRVTEPWRSFLLDRSKEVLQSVLQEITRLRRILNVPRRSMDHPARQSRSSVVPLRDMSRHRCPMSREARYRDSLQEGGLLYGHLWKQSS